MEMIFPKVSTKQFGFTDAAQKALAIEVLKKARTRIDSQSEHWVCLAIGDVCYPERAEHRGDYGQTAETEIIGKTFEAEIDRRLGNNAFVTSWLQDEMGLDEYDDKPFTSREYRLAWIDSMIKELE